MKSISQKIQRANQIAKNSDRLLENILNAVMKNLTINNRYIEILNNININIDCSQNRYYMYIDENFSEWDNVITLREKLFIVQYVENLEIDLTEEEKYKLLNLMGKELFRYINFDYAKILYNQSCSFDDRIWKELIEDKNFLDFYTTVYFSKSDIKKRPFMTFTKNEVSNVFEILAYTMRNDDRLKLLFEELMQKIINNSGNRKSYPFDLEMGRNQFMTEYFKDRSLSTKEKEFILREEHIDSFLVIILENDSFSKEEKEKVMDSIDYNDFMNCFLYGNIFKLKDCLNDDYKIIDVPRLLMMDTNNLRVLLERVIDKNKVPRSYNPYYSFSQYDTSSFLNFSETNSIDFSQLKKDYIENFVDLIEFYKKVNCLRLINNTVGIVKVGDEYGEKHLETEFIDAIRKDDKQKVKNYIFKKGRQKNDE